MENAHMHSHINSTSKVIRPVRSSNFCFQHWNEKAISCLYLQCVVDQIPLVLVSCALGSFALLHRFRFLTSAMVLLQLSLALGDSFSLSQVFLLHNSAIYQCFFPLLRVLLLEVIVLELDWLLKWYIIYMKTQVHFRY